VREWAEISDADRMATLAHFTARAIADARAWLPAAPSRWLVCGGGARNPVLIATLAELLAPASVETTASAGVDPQAVEAVSFALLAHARLLGQPNTIAAVTGATRAVSAGQITPGRGRA